ncbi:hypothetical protein GCM10023116_15020 [Kistimonas scapharcae]|uniref:Uncharacterized protein n=1 Tax=Kistimonas scapharcae TaxID=1036133 RepID=A0ABP8UZ61_9GAMM
MLKDVTQTHSEQSEFDWNLVPTLPVSGFVDYEKIHSPMVRKLIMREEVKRLESQLESKQGKTSRSSGRIMARISKLYRWLR